MTNGQLLDQIIDMKFERKLDNQRKALLVSQLKACEAL